MKYVHEGIGHRNTTTKKGWRIKTMDQILKDHGDSKVWKVILGYPKLYLTKKCQQHETRFD